MKIRIKTGIYHSHVVTDRIFTNLAPEINLKAGTNGSYLMLLNEHYDDLPRRVIKIHVNQGDFEVTDDLPAPTSQHAASSSVSDAELDLLIREKFQLMETMVAGCATQLIKGLVVSGAPGVGKSHEIQRILENNGYQPLIYEQTDDADIVDEAGGLDDELAAVDNKFYVLIKGRITPLGLYQTLFKHQTKIIVFDDCDSVLEDSVSLNLLKAALDSYERRYICYNSRAIGGKLPRKFEFSGTIIFISNMHFDNVRDGTKLKSHLEAIMSRCHFLNLDMQTNREKIIRIQQVVQKHDLLIKYDLTDTQKAEIIEYIVTHQAAMREISLRTALKLADIRCLCAEDGWEKMAGLSVLHDKKRA